MLVAFNRYVLAQCDEISPPDNHSKQKNMKKYFVRT